MPIDPYDILRQAANPVRSPKQEEPPKTKLQDALTGLKKAPPPVQSSPSPVFSALSGAANLLDLPGSMVRDVVSVENPFDQLLHPFSSKGRATTDGRELLRRKGLVGDKDNWGNFSAGLATDIVLDPLSWLTAGISGAGKSVATNAGKSVSKVITNSSLDDLAKGAALHAGKTPAKSVIRETIEGVTNKLKKPKEITGNTPPSPKPNDVIKESPLTARGARSLATPVDIVIYHAKREGDMEYDRLLKLAEESSRQSGVPVDAAAKASIKSQADTFGDSRGSRLWADLKNATLKDDDINTSIGGNFAFTYPFLTKNVQFADNILNPILGKDKVINGVFGAKKFNPSKDQLDAFERITKTPPAPRVNPPKVTPPTPPASPVAATTAAAAAANVLPQNATLNVQPAATAATSPTVSKPAAAAANAAPQNATLNVVNQPAATASNPVVNNIPTQSSTAAITAAQSTPVKNVGVPDAPKGSKIESLADDADPLTPIGDKVKAPRVDVEGYVGGITPVVPKKGTVSVSDFIERVQSDVRGSGESINAIREKIFSSLSPKKIAESMNELRVQRVASSIFKNVMEEGEGLVTSKRDPNKIFKVSPMPDEDGKIRWFKFVDKDGVESKVPVDKMHIYAPASIEEAKLNVRLTKKEMENILKGQSNNAVDSVKEEFEKTFASLVNDKSINQDALQNASAVLLRNLDKFEPGTNMRSWILTAAKNAEMDLIRKDNAVKRGGAYKKVDATQVDVPDRVNSPSDVASYSESVKMLLNAIDTLPDIEKAIHRARLQEEPFEKIASDLGMTVAQAKAAYSRGEKKVKKLLLNPKVVKEVKEPWQLTKAEHVAERERLIGILLELSKKHGGGWQAMNIKEVADAFQAQAEWSDIDNGHMPRVLEAIAKGLPVPPEVVAEYRVAIEQLKKRKAKNAKEGIKAAGRELDGRPNVPEGDTKTTGKEGTGQEVSQVATEGIQDATIQGQERKVLEGTQADNVSDSVQTAAAGGSGTPPVPPTIPPAAIPNTPAAAGGSGTPPIPPNVPPVAPPGAIPPVPPKIPPSTPGGINPGDKDKMFNSTWKMSQAWGEAEELLGGTPFMRFFNMLFDYRVRSTYDKDLQKKARETTAALEFGERRAREEVAPFLKLWKEATWLDEKSAIKEFFEQQAKAGMKFAPEVAKLREVQQRRLVADRVSRLFEYIEGFTDDLPKEIPLNQKDQWREALGFLRDRLGSFQTTAKQVAMEKGITVEEARYLLQDDIVGATGRLGDEYRSGLFTYPLLDRYIKKYWPRQESNMPTPTLAEAMRQWEGPKSGTKFNPHSGPMLETESVFEKQRQQTLADVPRGSAMINRMSTDQMISGIYKKMKTQDKTGMLPEVDAMLNTSGVGVPEGVDTVIEYMQTRPEYRAWFDPVERLKDSEIKEVRNAMLANPAAKKYEDLALPEDLIKKLNIEAEASGEILGKLKANIQYIAHLDPGRADLGIAMFTGDIFGNFLNRMQRGIQTEGTAKVLVGAISKHAKLRSDFDANNTSRAEILNAQGHKTIEKFLLDRKNNSLQMRRRIVELLDDAEDVRSKILDARTDKIRDSKSISFVDDYQNKIILKYNKDADLYEYSVQPSKFESMNDYGLEGEFAPKNYLDRITKSITPMKDTVRLIWDEEKGIIETKMKNVGDSTLISREEAESLLTVSNSDVLNQYAMPRKITNDLEFFMKPFQSPEWAGGFVKAFDKYSNFWKALHTGTFPFYAFHVRNLTGGQFANATTDALDNPLSYAKSLRDSDTIQRFTDRQAKGIAEPDIGLGNIPALNANGLSPEDQYWRFADQAFADGIIGGRQGLAAEQLGHSIDSVASQIPGGTPMRSPAPEGVHWSTRWLDPTAMKGVRGDDTAWQGALWGQDWSKYVEGQNRIAPYRELLRNGFSPERAAEIVKGAQIDYTKLSDFEREVMRRIMPFYSFSSGAARHYVPDVLDRPGGVTAQAIRAAGRARDDNANAPEHVMEQTAIPLGQSEDGTNSYITGLGLGFEDPMGFVSPLAQMNPQETFRDAAGRLNPLIKAAVEGWTGVSTFQKGPQGQRYLEDMDPQVGRIITNISDLATGERTERAQPFISPEVEFALQNSPASRYMNFARTVTDPRKWDNPLYALMNLGTGVKVSQVSPGQQEAIERGRIAAELRKMGGQNFTTPYLPQNAAESLSDIETEQANALMERLKELTKRAKERRKEKARQAQSSSE
jgi:RNA polymerase sigma factor (sigma-70 family)